MEQSGCGCPPTTASTSLGRVHHVFVNVKRLDRAREFYGWLMPRLGYGASRDFGAVCGWMSATGSFWVKAAGPRFAGDEFHKDRVGLAEIAFAAGSRGEVDALAGELQARGATILDSPREYPEYVRGYYAVFFTDPDGLKLELVHIPDA